MEWSGSLDVLKDNDLAKKKYLCMLKIFNLSDRYRFLTSILSNVFNMMVVIQTNFVFNNILI